MKHAYVTGPRKIAIADEPIPQPGAGEVLVRLAYTAISPGSNVHVYVHGSYSSDTRGRGEAVYMGSGRVEAVGPEVTDLTPGDPVAMTGNGHQEFVVLPSAKVHRVPHGLELRDASLIYL